MACPPLPFRRVCSSLVELENRGQSRQVLSRKSSKVLPLAEPSHIGYLPGLDLFFVALLVVGRRSFSVMILSSHVLLPIVWVHTLQVLFVPAALAFNEPEETLGRLRRLRRTGSRAAALPNIRPAER